MVRRKERKVNSEEKEMKKKELRLENMAERGMMMDASHPWPD